MHESCPRKSLAVMVRAFATEPQCMKLMFLPGKQTWKPNCPEGRHPVQLTVKSIIPKTSLRPSVWRMAHAHRGADNPRWNGL